MLSPPPGVFEVVVNSEAGRIYPTHIQIRQIGESSKLTVDVKNGEFHSRSTAKADVKGVYSFFFQTRWPNKCSSRQKATYWESVVEGKARKAVASIGGITEPLEQALNGQGAFAFPGGGTFEMRDPIFSKAGDLMIGLICKQGNAVGDEDRDEDDS
ncbi:hypothetical protein ACJZ2D_000692 [Fusarium nematophilum]